MIDKLMAISPIDGRYAKQTEGLRAYFSEFALFQYRLRIEVEYFIGLCSLPLKPLEHFPKQRFSDLQDLYLDFGLEEAQRIKAIETTTNHDVKAVEYYIKEAFEDLGLGEFKEFIHFGLTSQDINNTALPLALKEMMEDEFMPLLGHVVVSLNEYGGQWADIAMLARTHGQPASPTRLGKEIDVFVERIDQQMRLMRHIPYAAKFGGATGNMNAHYAAFPEIDWQTFARAFVEDHLDLSRSFPTTQIEHYDHLAALCQNLERINTILIDLCRDVWTYISMDYFKQKVNPNEVGSSAMPHKVNPIDFENAEGNLGMANALFHHLAAKLPISRLQRDLTDSTVLRNLGLPFGYTLIALKSILRGLDKLLVNKAAIDADLESNWAVVAEAVQTILRREGYAQPYEALKVLTRKEQKPGRAEMEAFVKGLEVTEEVKLEILEITPFNYTGA